ncbi:MAG: leader peptidase (prepilin peptidase) / N-methyltransferase [Verrucomicrobiota bacterium]|jgi:leader peptidase (prepilin peptidase)/N-methyltransferase
MDNALAAYHFLFATVAFVVGAAIGSFLNVCIYRMPLDLGVNEPRRSFCPSCRVELRWYHNVPLLSWLFLRGRCANCGSPIAFRYFAVELLTALLFLAAWLQFSWPVAVAYWVFISLLIVGTFIDFDYFIIPDEVTIGGTVAGLVASFLVPPLMLAYGRWTALGTSALSAALGYVLLWIVLEAGKKAFGKKKIQLETPTPFTWTRKGDDADFVVGDEKELWSDYFSRESDLLILLCDEAVIDGRPIGKTDLNFHYNRVKVAGEEVFLDTIGTISGVVRELQIPREAMGRGDLKFLAAIGAFLGWRAVLFTVFAGSLLGSLVGLATMLVGKRVWSAKLPFGPYLAFGALVWMFFGQSLLNWYLGLLSP